MTTQTQPATPVSQVSSTVDRPVPARAGFGAVLRSEAIKMATVRSTGWILVAAVVLGAGLTIALCAGNAASLASGSSDESPGSFITVGMALAQVCALVLGVLVVTSEYGSGMIRATFAATPSRGTVLVAKALLVGVLLFVVGTVTALIGYAGGNWFLDREGIGLPLEGDVARSMYGSGLFLAGLGVLGVAVGFLVRHTAAAVSIVIAEIFVVETLVTLIPGDVGTWATRLVPGNSGLQIASPVSFIPDMLDPWPSFGVFALEVALLLLLAAAVVRRRDA